VCIAPMSSSRLVVSRPLCVLLMTVVRRLMRSPRASSSLLASFVCPIEPHIHPTTTTTTTTSHLTFGRRSRLAECLAYMRVVQLPPLIMRCECHALKMRVCMHASVDAIVHQPTNDARRCCLHSTAVVMHSSQWRRQRGKQVRATLASITRGLETS